MSEPSDRLSLLVERATPALLALSDVESARRPAPDGWSPRELLGHLIDSASNNHGRFVRAQLQDELVFPGYDQDAWVAVQRYGQAPWSELVELWRALNRHLARVVAAVPDEVSRRPRTRHNLDAIAWRTVPAGEATTLGFFMHDYVDHLEHHLAQILGPAWKTVEGATTGSRVRDAEARKRDRFRKAFSSLAGLPADADGEQVAAVGAMLREALLVFGSETPDNLACAGALGIERIDDGTSARRPCWGLSLAGTATPISSVLNAAEGVPVPEQVKEACPSVTQEQWDATLRMATMIALAFEGDPAPELDGEG